MVGWHHRLNGHEFEKTQEMAKDRKACMLQSSMGHRVRQDYATEQQQRLKNGHQEAGLE